MIGVSICTRSSAAARLSASGWLCASSISMPTHSDSARAASVNDFWIISMRRTSGCTMIGIGRARGVLRPGQRAALQAVARIGDGALVRGLGDAEALHADAEAGRVHHHEHRRHALVELADQPALGAVEIHDAGGVGLDAHLVLDGAAADAVALARRCRPPWAGTSAPGTARCPWCRPARPAGAPARDGGCSRRGRARRPR